MTLDEFKLLQPSPAKAPRRTQAHSNLVEACLTVCTLHGKVAWARHLNTGALKVENRFVRFGFPGCSDILGQLVTGNLLAIECKIAPDKPTPEQQTFLETVALNKGLAIVAYCPDDVTYALRKYYRD